MAHMTINDLIAQLKAIYGPELVGVTLYGSAARGEHVEKFSDLNVLVVVEQITMEHLRKESPVARSWREGGNPPPLTLNRAEWLGSADIFPIEYSDILAHHKVLEGTLPLDGISVRMADLRLQLEHEAISKLLRLRHAVLLAGRDPRALRELLEQSISTMLVLLRATLRLFGETPPADSVEVCGRVQARTGVDTSAVLRIVQHTRGRPKLENAEVEPLVERYLAAATDLATFLDQYIESPSA
jgi:hypothetical protein